MSGMPRNRTAPRGALRPRAAARLLGCCAVFLAAGTLAGCNDAQAGSLLGAGIGALAGQAIGGDTEATLIGTAIGAVGGYFVGNEFDKQHHVERYHHHPHGGGNYSY